MVTTHLYSLNKEHRLLIEIEDFEVYAKELYQELNEPDLEYDAFETGLKGYVKLKDEGRSRSTVC